MVGIAVSDDPNRENEYQSLVPRKVLDSDNLFQDRLRQFFELTSLEREILLRPTLIPRQEDHKGP